MADEYIRRDTALRAVTKRYGACRSPAQNRLLDEIRNDIKKIPAANVVPTDATPSFGYARWEEGVWREYDEQSGETVCYPNAALICTRCRHAFRKDALTTRSYCPECWAQMDGGNEP